MHTSNYFWNVPCSLPTAPGEAALGENQAGQMQVHRLLLAVALAAVALGHQPGALSPGTARKWRLLLIGLGRHSDKAWAPDAQCC